MQVKDLMTAQVVTLNPDSDLALAERLMKESRIRHLPVVDDVFALIGLVTQSDILHASLSRLHGASAADLRMKERVNISQVMRTELFAVSPETDLLEAGRQMAAHKYGCLPVVAGNELVGIITDSDFLQLACQVLEAAAQDEALETAVRAASGH